MESSDLQKLHTAVEWLQRQESFTRGVEHLRGKLSESHEPFVWTTIALDTIPVALPASIQSCWIFLLKRGVPSGSHFHPNSIQHMVALNGEGQSTIGGVQRQMIPFGAPGHAIEEKWYVIVAGVPHEFFPEVENMVVVSFHTCPATDLVEIASDSGARRHYAS